MFVLFINPVNCIKKNTVFPQVSHQSSLANINAMNASPITPSFCDNVRTGQSHWRRRRRGVFWGWLSGRETWQWKIHWSIAVSIAVFDYQRLLIILSSKKIGESRRPQKIRIEIEHHETWVDPSSRNPRSAWISLTVLVCLALCLPSIKNKAFERNTMRPTI